MRLPSWLRVVRTARAPGSVTVTLVADTTQFTAAMRRVTTEVSAMQTWAETMVGSLHRIAKRYEVLVAGWEATMYVRGGADPTYAHPDARDAYVRELLGLPAGNRMAASFISGWCDSYERDEPREPYVLYRTWPARRDDIGSILESALVEVVAS